MACRLRHAENDLIPIYRKGAHKTQSNALFGLVTSEEALPIEDMKIPRFMANEPGNWTTPLNFGQRIEIRC